jgi:FkbM family methyltransferase
MNIAARPFPLDKAVLNEVWLENCYDPNVFGMPFDWRQCRTIIDIGSRLGSFALYAAAKSPQAHVYAYEPDPQNAALIQKSLQLSSMEDRVTLREQAVAGTSGSMDFYSSEECSGWSSLYPLASAARRITVPVVTLSQLLDEHSIGICDFIKIDCEGAEYDMLYRCPREVLKRLRFIALEYHRIEGGDSYTPSALAAFLREHGFEVSQYKKYHLFARQLGSHA